MRPHRQTYHTGQTERARSLHPYERAPGWSAVLFFFFTFFEHAQQAAHVAFVAVVASRGWSWRRIVARWSSRALNQITTGAAIWSPVCWTLNTKNLNPKRFLLRRRHGLLLLSRSDRVLLHIYGFTRIWDCTGWRSCSACIHSLAWVNNYCLCK